MRPSSALGTRRGRQNKSNISKSNSYNNHNRRQRPSSAVATRSSRHSSHSSHSSSTRSRIQLPLVQLVLPMVPTFVRHVLVDITKMVTCVLDVDLDVVLEQEKRLLVRLRATDSSFNRVVQQASLEVIEDIWQYRNILYPENVMDGDDGNISFETFASWYTHGGYQGVVYQIMRIFSFIHKWVP